MNKSTIQINFGLIASERFPEYARKRVLAEVNTATTMAIPYVATGILCDLVEQGFTILHHEVRDSASEPTLCIVAEVPKYDHTARSKLYTLTTRYAQDCIAVRTSPASSVCSASGELIGLHANLWGEFNNDYFIGL